METIQAKWFTPASNRTIKWAVIHSMEAANKGSTAENVGRFFQTLPEKRKASAHVGVDENSAVRYVADKDVAFAAPGANAEGLHLELAGYARFSAAEWSGPGMDSMLAIAAGVIRDWCDRYGIPRRFVDAAALKRGERGITTHYEVSQAFKKSDHWDPGKGFPITSLIDLVRGGTQTKEIAMGVAIEPVGSATHPNGDAGWVFGRRGHVYSFNGSGFFGGWPEGEAGPTNRSGRDCVALVPTESGNGYFLVSDTGELFAYGDAKYPGGYQSQWGKGEIIGAFRNRKQAGGGVTLVRDDGANLNQYALPV